jgi:hypothetical protein
MESRVHFSLAVRDIKFLRSSEQRCANHVNEEKEEDKENRMRMWRKNMEVEVKQ